MSTPAPSAHAARTGAWALLVVLATDLVYEVARRLMPLLGLHLDRSAGDFDWFLWLQWFDRADLPLRALLTGIAVVGLLRLRRGTADAGARAMFLGSAVSMVLGAAVLLWYQRLVANDLQAGAALASTFLPLALAAERLAAGLLLAALWRARRAWGLGVGMAWCFAALLYGLRLALIVGANVLGPEQVDSDDFVRRGLMLLAFYVTDIGALMATLLAFARVAPGEPAADRLTAAAAGLDLYFRALVTRVTVLVVGVVVTLAFGLTSPATRGKLLFAVLVVPLPTLIAQVAGLTRYADAPVAGRGALGLALVTMGLGAAIEVLTLVLYAWMVWPEDSSASRAETLAYADMLKYAGAGGQVVALVGALALLLSLRRAAIGLEAPALQQRATALLTALVGVAAGAFVLLRLFAQTLVRTPAALLGLGLVALVVGVTVFVSWLRLVEGVAQELRARAKKA
ncbi:hypothetical protein OV203_25625 [Nannocystis sp. ILAH1]|uniref:hypothetical protein n=1 Tax=unclassified Nannocystis TaxID=2627009 RepID=UPI00226D48C1|nr:MULTISPECIES: hypothetical protein [unclassified Nannocystis]MCY0990548.1 hypothetical protein [Nannocystis sp. ILAH1]MCY1072118.1 hypothetical protein [Nannocystis sp. RBIL2]